MDGSFVVTGAARGIGRAVVERLARGGARVVAVDLDAPALAWTAAIGVAAVVGHAADEDVVGRAAEAAQDLARLTGWVNNAAVFRDASLHTEPIQDVLDLIGANLAPTVVGCAVAVRTFLAAGGGGAIVNVSSHQAARPVAGCVPYATAKAAIEGLTRALAVEYGPSGVRVNAVALGSIRTERYDGMLAGLGPDAAAQVEAEMALIHPVGRVGTADEAAAAIVQLLSPAASFISGATVPVDGGRSVAGRDPEAH